MRRVIVSAFLLFASVALFGQESSREIKVHFLVDHTYLDESFGNNAARLSEIISFLQEVNNDSSMELLGITFSSSASPEGTILRNRNIAAGRMSALENYVRERISIPENLITRAYSEDNFIDWEHLISLVEASDMPYKEEALNVMRNVPILVYDSEGNIIDSRNKQLMELRYGRTWNYMIDNLFPEVRNAGIVIFTMKHLPASEPEIEPKPEPEPAPQPEPESEPIVEEIVVPAPEAEKKPFYMAVKTNLLYDLAAVPNIGVEFYLGKNWSVNGNAMYAWWSSDSKNFFWRIYGGDLSVRKWFGKKANEKPLTGHHLGLNAQLFTYDFELGNTGYMGGTPGGTLLDKHNYAAGIEYGYSLPIARRFNLDFSAVLGYWGGIYHIYTPIDDIYLWQETKERNWIGPTKLDISLVWLIGRGNYNIK